MTWHSLDRLLHENPSLAAASLGGDPDQHGRTVTRTLLHVATDWPGHFPNGPGVVAALLAAGADVDGRFSGPHTETPLHWAASCDDVPVLDVLLDAGADIEAPTARSSAAAPRSPTPSRSGSGGPPTGWSSAAPAPSCGRRPRSA